jgi:hypothetical protein
MTSNDWIPFTGWTSPLPPDVRCDVNIKDHGVERNFRSDHWDWANDNIVEYRITCNAWDGLLAGYESDTMQEAGQ